jgi:hypothetical protein
VNYRTYLDAYVTPIIGESAIQDVTPVRLNLLYGYLTCHRFPGHQMLRR